MNKITIDGKVYAPVTTDSDLKIAVLQRGNVIVGTFTRDGDMCEMTNASVVRKWGTTRGLGQIAANGPHPVLPWILAGESCSTSLPLSC